MQCNTSVCVFTGKYNSAFGGGGSTYAYYHEEDESSFQLVDTQKIQKPIYTRGRRMFQQVSFKFVSHKSYFSILDDFSFPMGIYAVNKLFVSLNEVVIIHVNVYST